MLFPSNYQGKLRIASARREKNKRGKETNHKLTTTSSNIQCCAMKETLTKQMEIAESAIRDKATQETAYMNQPKNVPQQDMPCYQTMTQE
jgi:hypothetical protein